MLLANAGVLGVIAPIGHVEAKVLDRAMAINVTANWRLSARSIRCSAASDGRPRASLSPARALAGRSGRLLRLQGGVEALARS